VSGIEGVELVYRLFSEKKLTKAEALILIGQMEADGAPGAVLHPLLHENCSTLAEQRFTSSFSGAEYFFKDHAVQKRPVMPGVALIEMALAAFARSAEEADRTKKSIRFRNIVWARPLAAPEQGRLSVDVALSPDDCGEVRFEISSHSGGDSAEAEVCCQGAVSFVPFREPSKLDPAALRNALNANRIDGAECYEAFRAAGIEYGPAFRGIEAIFHDTQQVLTKIHLPGVGADGSRPPGFDAFTVHPVLLDVALQGCIGLSQTDNHSFRHGLLLPFALEECEVLAKCTPEMWSLIRRAPGSTASDRVQKVDIDLCAADGTVCVRFKGLSSRECAPSEKFVPHTVIANPVWQNAEHLPSAGATRIERYLAMCCDVAALAADDVKAAFRNAEYISIESGASTIEARFEEVAVRAFEALRGIMEPKDQRATLVQILVPSQREGHLYTALAGLVRTARIEQPRLLAQLIEVSPQADSASVVAALKECTRRPEESHLRFDAGHCKVRTWQEEAPLSGPPMKPWKDGGVYLLTGGATGLGLIFAKEIAKQAGGVVLFLIGRSAPGDQQRKAINEIENQGATVVYRQLDVSVQAGVDALVSEIVARYGHLNGVIHAAGVIHPRSLARLVCVLFLRRRSFWECRTGGLRNSERLPECICRVSQRSHRARRPTRLHRLHLLAALGGRRNAAQLDGERLSRKERTRGARDTRRNRCLLPVS
jgi:polyketide synthase PksN